MIQKKFKVNTNYLIREVAGEYLLVAIDQAEHSQNQLMMLNETGSFIWENLQEELTMEELVDRARKEFNDADGLIEEHICEFVMALVNYGLIYERS